MSDFLLELRSEEIPARMQIGARSELEKLFRREMESAGVTVHDVTVWSTPRRLALIARGLPTETRTKETEVKGPRVGAPDQAIEGFLRRYQAKRDDLVERTGIYFLPQVAAGLPMMRVLQEAIPSIIRAFAWPKSMRWGAASISNESLRWVRPLSGIVALLGEELVECEVHGVTSGWVTLGHRFHHSGDITIGSATDYAEKLRACHVIVDHEERQDMIRAAAAKVASDAGLTLVEDEGLVVENAGLTEWPVPLLGRFDEAFLDVPPEVIQLTARVNQKYFVCTSPLPLAGGAGGGPDALDSPTPNPSRKREGDLANAFVCTANIHAEDPAVVVDGNRKVLAARLSDARFFWEQDRKTSLEDHAKKLARITFHEKLGTVADKVERVAKLARWLVEEGIVNPPRNGEGDHAKHGGGARAPAPDIKASDHTDAPLHQPAAGPPPPAGEERAHLADLAEQAARLAKADLVTEMVGEFPELQGLMGGYYAEKEGLPAEVADAIRDHYKPVGQGDEVPTAPVTVAVSLADKLDSIVGFFAADDEPSGSRDPYALRRAVLSIIRLITANDLRFDLSSAIRKSYVQFIETGNVRAELCAARMNQMDPDRLVLMDWTWDLVDSRDYAPIFLDSGFKYNEFDDLHVEAFDSHKSEFMAGAPHPLRYVKHRLLDFFADRLKVQQREAGVRHDLIDAVFALGGEDDLIRLLARVRALQSFITTEDGANLLAAYKRAANILKKEDWQGIEGEIAQTGEEDPLAMVDDPDLKAVVDAKMAERHQKQLSYTPEPAEKALIEALAAAGPTADAAIAAEDFEGAMAALASLRAPIDRFFDEVIVNVEDPDQRAARLDLLAQFRAAVHNVADFSRIEG